MDLVYHCQCYQYTINFGDILQKMLTMIHVAAKPFCSFGQGSSLFWTHALRPFINRPIALAQGGESFG